MTSPVVLEPPVLSVEPDVDSLDSVEVEVLVLEPVVSIVPLLVPASASTCVSSPHAVKIASSARRRLMATRTTFRRPR